MGIEKLLKSLNILIVDIFDIILSEVTLFCIFHIVGFRLAESGKFVNYPNNLTNEGHLVFFRTNPKMGCHQD